MRHQTVANLLKRHDIASAPERRRSTSWLAFTRLQSEALAADAFFTAEVWTACGLTNYYVLTRMRVATLSVYITGITTKSWMGQMARNLNLAEIGFLNGSRYLLHDPDAKF